jgi:hypothetical protein
MKHYIGMAGLRGCIPNYCEVYPDRKSAIESLADLHELGQHSKFRQELRQTGTSYLNLHTHGNEYMEIVDCDCNTPWEHSEDSDPKFLDAVYAIDQFSRTYGENSQNWIIYHLVKSMRESLASLYFEG